MFIDVNAHLGAWPFSLTPERTAPALAKHLAAHGVSRALVSPLGAVFQPDPMPANRALCTATKRSKALVPVPVLNLRLANWREQLTECAVAGATAVKLLPNYHDYRLTSPVIADFMPALVQARLRLVVNVRFEDDRHRYFGLKVTSLPVAELDAFLKRYPKQHVLFTGIGRPEIMTLAKDHANFSADLAFCEWIETVRDLLTVIPASRLMLGTCTPLLNTRGGVDKLRTTRIPAKVMRQIGSANAIRFFKL